MIKVGIVGGTGYTGVELLRFWAQHSYAEVAVITFRSEAGLRQAAGCDVGLTFVLHLTPVARGIHPTLYAYMADPSVDLQTLFEECYANDPFVKMTLAGSQPEICEMSGRVLPYRPCTALSRWCR